MESIADFISLKEKIDRLSAELAVVKKSNDNYKYKINKIREIHERAYDNKKIGAIELLDLGISITKTAKIMNLQRYVVYRLSLELE